MTMIASFLTTMEKHADELAVGSACGQATYREILASVRSIKDQLEQNRITAGRIVSLKGEYDPPTIAAFLALTENGNIIVPLTKDAAPQHDRFSELGQVEICMEVDSDTGRVDISETGVTARHELFDKLRQGDVPGLILFTSGSTGESKAVVHDINALLEKYLVPRQCLRTLVFLQLDHIGGINTLLYTLSNGGAVIAPSQRTPQSVCEAIQQYRADLLPTSPTFLNLLMLSGCQAQYDLSSLKLITYGTEPMPESTLQRVHQAFPEVKLQQTYGMTELGILRSKSRDSGSLWVRVGGEGFETKVVDGRLWVRARSIMLGYLNAPSPFDEEGFFDTGDRVEVDGEWLRILGRESEIINVGGSKVYPAEVESVLLQMDDVTDVAVSSESHPLTGQVVTARIRPSGEISRQELKLRMRRFCKDRLPSYAVPVRIELSKEVLHSSRYKRIR